MYFSMNFLTESSKEKKVGVYTVTPEIALKILKSHNPYNRIISTNKLSQYKKLFKSNNFQSDGNSPPIVFDWDGNLIDGQHRILAVAKSNVEAKFTCLFGFDPNARFYFDQGKPRTTSDIATMGQLNFDSAYATSWVKGMFLSNPNCGSKCTKTNVEIMNLARKYKDGLDFVCGIKRNYKPLYSSFVRAQIFKSPLVKAYYHEEQSMLLEFTECFESGKVKQGVNPAPYNLANAFIKVSRGGKSTATRTTADRRLWFMNTEEAIYCFCNGLEWEFNPNATENPRYPLPEFDVQTNTHQQLSTLNLASKKVC